MYVKKIDWLDEVSKEAIVEVAEGIERLVCFSCPCLYKLNDMLRDVYKRQGLHPDAGIRRPEHLHRGMACLRSGAGGTASPAHPPRKRAVHLC